MDNLSLGRYETMPKWENKIPKKLCLSHTPYPVKCL